MAKNSRYKNSDAASPFNLKQNVNTFLDDLADLNFSNIIKNGLFGSSTLTGGIVDWTYTGVTPSAYNAAQKYLPVTIAAAGFIEQAITSSLTRATNYTFIFYGSASVSNALKISVYATNPNQITNLDTSVVEVNSASIFMGNASAGAFQKHVVTFKTTSEASISGTISVKVTNTTGAAVTASFRSFSCYSSLIEVGSLPGDGFVSFDGVEVLRNKTLVTPIVDTSMSASGTTFNLLPNVTTLDIGNPNEAGVTTIHGSVKLPKNSEGVGYNLQIGDDTQLIDIATPNSLRIQGVQDPTKGYISFGNGGDVAALGRSGSGPLTYNGDMVLAGNFTVNGTTTTINSTTITVDDKNIELGSVASPTDATADGGGMSLAGATTKYFQWQNIANSPWTSSENMNLVAGKGYYIGNVKIVDNTTFYGNAVTASKVVATAPVGGSQVLVSGIMGANDSANVTVGGATDAGWLEIATGDNGTEPIYVRQYAASAVEHSATLLDESGNTSFPHNVSAATFNGVDLVNNAESITLGDGATTNTYLKGAVWGRTESAATDDERLASTAFVQNLVASVGVSGSIVDVYMEGSTPGSKNYVHFSDNFIVQWGTCNSGVAVTFPTPFDLAPNVFISSAGTYAGASLITTTSFTGHGYFHDYESGFINGHWFAIGKKASPSSITTTTTIIGGLGGMSPTSYTGTDITPNTTVNLPFPNGRYIVRLDLSGSQGGFAAIRLAGTVNGVRKRLVTDDGLVDYQVFPGGSLEWDVVVTGGSIDITTEFQNLSVLQCQATIYDIIEGATGNTYIAMTEEYPSGTACPDTVTSGWNVRKLNTSKSDITGFTLANGSITCPPGTYQVAGSAIASQGDNKPYKLRVKDLTSGSTLVLGTSSWANGDDDEVECSINGVFTLTDTHELQLQMYLNSGIMGAPTSSGENEVYSSLTLIRLS
jgi:hypothetical protein